MKLMSKSKTIGQLLKEARIKKGLTQVEVAKKAKLHSNTVAKIEREEQVPEFPTSLSIGDVVGVPESEITKYYRKS